MRFRDTNGSPNIGQTTQPYNNQQKKRTYKIVNFAVPADHTLKLKESEKKEKYFHLAIDLKKLRNMKVTVTPIIIGSLGINTKGSIQELEDLEITGREKTIQTTAILKSTRILRRVLEF